MRSGWRNPNRIQLAAVLAILAAFALAACGSDDSDEGGDSSASGSTLNLLSWEGYDDAKWVKPFKKKNNIKVKSTYIASEDELFSKIRQGGGEAFDIVAGSRALIPTLKDAGLIVPIDPAGLEGRDSVGDSFKKNTTVGDDVFNAPYVWGSVGLAYAKKAFPTPPDSWGVVFGADPEACGKIILSEDAGSTITTAAMYLGLENPNALTDEDYAKVKDLLLKAKECTKAYYSGFGDAANYFASGDAVAGFSLGSLIPKLAKEKNGTEVVETIPKEGGIGWVDGWMVTKGGAKKTAAVNKWLNYVQTPEVQKAVVEKTSFGPVVDGVADELSPELRTILHLDDPQYVSRLQPLATPQPPDSVEKRLALWNQIRGQ